MLKSFWIHVSSLLMAGPRPQATLGIAVLMLTCGLTTACSSGSPTVGGGSSPSSALPTVTSGNSTVTGTTSTSTPSASGPLACTALSPLVPVLQAGKLHVTFEMTAAPDMALKGSVTSFHDAGGLTMSGEGYLVSPNDPIQIQIAQSTSPAEITVKNTTTGKVTTFTANTCSTKTSNDIELTGTDPTSFTLDILITP
jgi:hypothetical protein